MYTFSKLFNDSKNYNSKQKREHLAEIQVHQNILLGVYKDDPDPLQTAIKDYKALVGIEITN